MLVWYGFGPTDLGRCCVRTTEISIMRVYVTEGEGKLKEILDLLHDNETVRGVTVFRGIAGFGPTGEVHISSLSDLSLDLPLVIELFDEPGKMLRVMKILSTMVKPGHILSWSGKMNVDGIE